MGYLKEKAEEIRNEGRRVDWDDIPNGEAVAVIRDDWSIDMIPVWDPSKRAKYWNRHNHFTFYVLPKEEEPAVVHDPGTLAWINVSFGELLAFRMNRGTSWIDADEVYWYDSEIADVKVIATPDGTCPVPEITEEEAAEILDVWWDRRQQKRGTLERCMVEAVQLILNKKFRGQA